jgi:hypothetical protein
MAQYKAARKITLSLNGLGCYYMSELLVFIPVFQLRGCKTAMNMSLNTFIAEYYFIFTERTAQEIKVKESD